MLREIVESLGETVIMDNSNGKKFMETIYDLLDSGVSIESYAIGRWGMLSIPMDRKGINITRGKKKGWTSFISGDRVELIKSSADKYKIMNIITKNI